MSKQYNRKDSFYKKAKSEGYRSRASYKLIEIEERFNVFRGVRSAVDLGCFPGGWLRELAGSIGLVMSDMSPKLSGIKFRDVAESANLVEAAFEFANQHLRTGGNIITKIFPGHESDELFKRYNGCYKKLKRATLKSSRNSSKEFYFVGLGKQSQIISEE